MATEEQAPASQVTTLGRPPVRQSGDWPSGGSPARGSSGDWPSEGSPAGGPVGDGS